MKQTMISTMALALLCAATPVCAGELVLGNAHADPGQTLTVPVVYTPGARPAAGLATDIRFNPGVLGNPHCTLGSALAGSGKDVHCAQPKPGLLRMGIFGLNLDAVAGGEVAQITFDVAPSASRRTYRLQQKASAADAQGKDFALKHRDGTLKIGQ